MEVKTRHSGEKGDKGMNVKKETAKYIVKQGGCDGLVCKNCKLASECEADVDHLTEVDVAKKFLKELKKSKVKKDKVKSLKGTICEVKGCFFVCIDDDGEKVSGIIVAKSDTTPIDIIECSKNEIISVKDYTRKNIDFSNIKEINICGESECDCKNKSESKTGTGMTCTC